MSRYTGPKKKLCRREWMNLFGSEKYNIKPSRWGQRRTKLSEYGIQLRAKQAAKRMFWITEKQFKSYYKRWLKSQWATGHNMMKLLHSRIDFVVYQSWLARTIMQSRQFVNHSHFLLNEKKADIPSMIIEEGDIITVKDRLKESPIYKWLVEEFQEFAKKNKNASISQAKWLEVDAKNLSIKILRLPDSSDFLKEVDIQKIIEFYSK